MNVGRIEQAALLHDLGKVAVPDALLRKPAGLTPTEQEIMHRHCLVGARILSGSRHPLLQEAERIARSHHERWDGTGYPDAIRAEEIPLSARITAVADAWDSLTHVRPYRGAREAEGAMAEILSERGAQFDPAVVDALVRLQSTGALDSLERVSDAVGEWLGDGDPSDALVAAGAAAAIAGSPGSTPTTVSPHHAPGNA